MGECPAPYRRDRTPSLAATSIAAIAPPEQEPPEHDAGFAATLQAHGVHDFQISAIVGQKPKPRHAVLQTRRRAPENKKAAQPGRIARLFESSWCGREDSNF